MLNKIVFTLLFLFSFSTFAQYENKVKYQECLDCPNDLGKTYNMSDGYLFPGDYNYGSYTFFPAHEIDSDFGRREKTSNKWHTGNDWGLPPVDDNCCVEMGNAILPIEPGIVSRIVGGNGYKLIIIEGIHRYSYAHIFYDGTPDPLMGMPLGNFILKKMDAERADEYAIVYYNNSLLQNTFYAIGAVEGTVTLPFINGGNPIDVERTVNFGDAIAPIGNSGGPYVDHIHLDLIINSDLPAIENTKDPLSILDYTTNLELSLADSNLNYYPITYIMAEVKMSSKNLIDIDYVDLKIKKEGESAYSYIQGKHFDSKIHLGARLNTERYPTEGNPSGNTIDIDNNYPEGRGTEIRTGIESFGGKIDRYYFASDNIEFRIHSDDVMNDSTVLLAFKDVDARYRDGNYTLQLIAENVKGEVILSESNEASIEHDISIDNFWPFVEKVEIISAGQPVYEGAWLNTSENNYQFSLQNPNALLSGEAFEVIITTSELCTALSLSIPELAYEEEIDNESPSLTHHFNISAEEVLVSTIDINTFHLIIAGEDVSGNPIEALNPTHASNNTYTNPIRETATNWSPNPFSPYVTARDEMHSVPYGCSTYRALTNETCVNADFNYQINNHTISLTNYASGATSYLWDFGNGESSTEVNPVVTYSFAGQYDVSLTAYDEEGNFHTRSRPVVIATEYDFTIDFEELNALAGNQIFVSGIAATELGQLEEVWLKTNSTDWQLANGTSDWSLILDWQSSDTKVLAKAKNSLGDWTPVKSILIDGEPEVDFDFSVNNNSVQFYDTSEPEPFSWYWDFGDGSNASEKNPFKTYSQAGNYQVKLLVENGFEAQEVTKTLSVGSVPTNIEISGFVYNYDNYNQKVSGAEVTFEGLEGSVYTNAQGYYIKSVPYNWSGGISVSKNGWTPINSAVYVYHVTEATERDLFLDEIQMSLERNNIYSTYYEFKVIGAPYEASEFYWHFSGPQTNYSYSTSSNSTAEVLYCHDSLDYTYQLTVDVVLPQGIIPLNASYTIPNCSEVNASYYHPNQCHVHRLGSCVSFNDISQPLDEISRFRLSYGDGSYEVWDTEHCVSQANCFDSDHKLYRGNCRSFEHCYHEQGFYHFSLEAENLAGELSEPVSGAFAVVDCEQTVENILDAVIQPITTGGFKHYYAGKFDLSYVQPYIFSDQNTVINACEKITLNPGVIIEPVDNHKTVLQIESCLQIQDQAAHIQTETDTYQSRNLTTTDEISDFCSETPLEFHLLRLYPNPNNGLFTIESNTSAIQGIKLYNALGSLLDVKEDLNTKTAQMDISDLSIGIYFVEVETESEKATLKLSYTQSY